MIIYLYLISISSAVAPTEPATNSGAAAHGALAGTAGGSGGAAAAAAAAAVSAAEAAALGLASSHTGRASQSAGGKSKVGPKLKVTEAAL